MMASQLNLVSPPIQTFSKILSKASVKRMAWRRSTKSKNSVV